VADRTGAVIADAGLNVEHAIGLDHEQAVEPDRPGAIRADRDADAAHFRSLPLAALQLALVPTEHLRAFIQRLLDERARHVLPHRLRTGRRAERRLAFGRVETANGHLIDPEFARRL